MKKDIASIGCMVACLLLTACAGGDAEGQRSDYQAVAFGADMATGSEGNTPTVRAVNIVNDLDALKAVGFGVYGCYTGLHRYADTDVYPDFMYNEHITWDATEWTYAPKKYWPNGEGETNPTIVTGENPHYVSFMGYAPYTAGATECIYNRSEQAQYGDPWVEYRLAPVRERQVDLLYAEPLRDEVKPDINERLLFHFRHALACVGDQIAIGVCDEYAMKYKKIVLTEVKVEYTLTEEGRLVLWSREAGPNWQLIADGTPTVLRSLLWQTKDEGATDDLPVTLYEAQLPEPSRATWSTRGYGVLYIPIQHDDYPQKARVTVKYTLYNNTFNEDKEVSTTLTLSDYADGYQAGRYLHINATICGSVDEPVLDGVVVQQLMTAVGPWTELDDKEREVYNW